MRKIFSALMSFVFAFLLGGNAVANTFAGGIPQTVPYTRDGITYDRYIVISRTGYNICSNTLALYFVSSEMKAAGWPNASNHYSLVLGYPQDIPSFNSQPNGSHMAIFSAVNVNGVCSWTANSFELVTTYHQGAYTLRADEGEAIHDHNFDLYTRPYVPSWGTLPHTFSGSYSSWGSWALDALEYGTATPGETLSFPLPNGSPSGTEVTSVMDRDTLGTGAVYAGGRNGTITTFNSQSGTAAAGCQCYSTGLTCDASNYASCSVPGYLKSGGGSYSFTNILTYIGTGSHLYYDAHPGYDYASSGGDPIQAPAAGKLCAAHDVLAPQSPSVVWRNTTHCPLASAPGTNNVNWTNQHVFYILHGAMHINGSDDHYMTVFLHNTNLETSVLSQVYENGYANVVKGQQVATVGSVGTGAAHMHLEVYKNVSGVWQRVDPYGDGTNNILWPH